MQNWQALDPKQKAAGKPSLLANEAKYGDEVAYYLNLRQYQR